MPTSVFQVLIALWLAVFALWFLTGLSTKRTVRSTSRGATRLADFLAGLGWWILLLPALRTGPLALRFLPEGPVTEYFGALLTVVGLAFAVWARLYLGRNWSALVTLKAEHKLMRTGPYGIVRHPIYSGFMLATIGTTIVVGETGGLVSCALVILAWTYKARVEESFMSQNFGAEYEQYRRDVKGLIPLVW